MSMKPQQTLTEAEVEKGLRLGIIDGLASEAMSILVSGTFLVAMALKLGASNFQIGLLAALPTFTNVFQLVSIWWVRQTNNRRKVSVLSSIFARVPLIVIGLFVLLLPGKANVSALIFFLLFYFFFASVAAPSWNAWMKDLVPEERLGTYFSKRGRYTQITTVILSIVCALLIDYVKDHYPLLELPTYSVMFILAGTIGLIGAVVLSRVPEPQSFMEKEHLFKLFAATLRDANFRSLLFFNSAWVFALNIATPFFTVFMLKTMGLPISYIISLTIISQLFSIFTIGLWGRFADKYSNKTIIAICGPLYIAVIVAWCFVGIYGKWYNNLILLGFIHLFTGIATAGINLSLTNIGLKLAPRNNAIVYLSVRNIITAVFSSLAPLVGGILADYFTKRQLFINLYWNGPELRKELHLVSLHEWNFLFLIGAILALLALELLVAVKEKGEVEKGVVVRIMRSSFRHTLKDNFITGSLMNLPTQLKGIITKRKNGPQPAANNGAGPQVAEPKV